MSRRLALALMVLGAATWAAEPAPPAAPVSSRRALVRFHTACASCHAGECSGRLSFFSGKGGAKHHIRRYAPTADDLVVKELFTLLATMKRTCRVELPADTAAQARWTGEQLREWFNPDANAWFIPLGELGPARVTVTLQPGAGAEAARAQVLDEELETLAEAPLAGKAVTLRFDQPQKGRCFLLVRLAPTLTSLTVAQ